VRRKSSHRSKEMTLPDNSKKQRADAQFNKLHRLGGGKSAVSEYEAGAAAIAAKTARLRELRLARDAAELAAAPPAAVAVKKVGRKKKPSGASLSDWLKGRQDGGHNN
jgi:hypothetical protein